MIASESASVWPPLSSDWADTCATLHMWTQVVGKVRLALAPPVNHWWHITLRPTARGLTTTPMPYGGRTLEIVFDFVDHRLRFDTSDGRPRQIVLEPKAVARFYSEGGGGVAGLGMPGPLLALPVPGAPP